MSPPRFDPPPAQPTRAADDDVGLRAELFERGARLESDDRLVEKHLVEDRSEHIAVAGRLDRRLDGLGDRAAERARRAGVLGVDEPSDVSRHRGRRRDVRAVGAHDLAAERLLLVGALHHEDVAVESEERARHRERRSPLARASLGRDALEALRLRVVRLRDGGVELVRAGRVVALELVVDLRRCAERLLEEVRAHEGRGAEHAVEVADLLGDLEQRGLVVELLADELLAEHGREIGLGAGLSGCGNEKRGGLLRHVGAQVVPALGKLALVEIRLVWNRLHIVKYTKKPRVRRGEK